MKRRLLFLYRYFTAPRRWRAWFNSQTLMFSLVTLGFLAAIAWSAPLSTLTQANSTPAVQQQATPDPNSGPTATPIPADYLETEPQSIGIVLAASMLVLIVIVGAISFMPRKD